MKFDVRYAMYAGRPARTLRLNVVADIVHLTSYTNLSDRKIY